MKVATEFTAGAILLGRETTARWRQLGLLIAVAVPVMFWTSLLAIVGPALGFVVSSQALVGCALAIGAWCLVGASAVIGGTAHRA
jgi:hypothetical protein